MPLETFVALVSFAFVMSFTPGPNNIMLTASGANFGLARSTPHMAGVVVGYALLLCAAGGGLGALIAAIPAVADSRSRSPAPPYLLWLACKVATAGAASEGDRRSAAR